MPFDNPKQGSFGDTEILINARNRVSDADHWLGLPTIKEIVSVWWQLSRWHLTAAALTDQARLSAGLQGLW